MKIVEIFQSIDGEVNAFYQGRLTTFVRTAGCNLNCSYCDTKYANEQVEERKEESPEKIFKKIESLGCRKITITGGEPLLQKDIWELIDLLCLHRYEISIETNGTCMIPSSFLTRDNISWVIDYKLDFASQMRESNYFGCIKKDWIKFVVQSMLDLKEIFNIKNRLISLGCRANFAISPVFTKQSQKGGVQDLLDCLILRKEFDFVINLQLHKFVNLK